MIKTKYKISILLLICLISLSVVCATDNSNNTDVSNQYSDSSNSNYNNESIVTDSKVNTKNFTNNKLSANIYTNNSDGLIIVEETGGDDVLSREEAYLDGIYVGAAIFEPVEEPSFCRALIDFNVLSDGSFTVSAVKRAYDFSLDLQGIREKTDFNVKNFTSNSNITFNNNLTNNNNNTITISTAIVNRKTNTTQNLSGIMEYYYTNKNYKYEYSNNLIATANVTNGLVNITLNKTNNYPLIMVYKNNNYTGYYITDINANKSVTWLEIKSHELIPSMNTNLSMQIHRYDKNTVNTGIVNYYINGELIGTSNVTNNQSSIMYKIPETLKGQTITFNAKYTNSTNTEPSEYSDQFLIKNKTAIKISVPYIKARLGSTIHLTANVTCLDKPLKQATAAIKTNGITIAHTNVTNGKININYTLNTKMFYEKRYNLSIVVGETWNTSGSRTNNSLDVVAYETKILYNKTTAKIGDIITLNVKITNNTDTYTPNNGLVGFKIDGITYKNANGPLITKVTNGYAQITFLVNKNLLGTHNITFTYSGNYQFKSTRTTFTNAFTITNGTPKTHPSKINYNYTSIPFNQPQNITITITDKTGKYHSTTGYAGLKIDGKTYTENNKTITSQIKNGTATFTINAPPQLIGTHNITFTYSGNQVLQPTKQTYNNQLTIRRI